jgi:hypothetical protein
MQIKKLFQFFFFMVLPSMLWGTHTGFTEHAISTSANSARSVFATDVDGDGDMDVLSASAGDDKIAWYENIPPPYSGPVWYVYTSGSDSNESSQSEPFATIQKGIDLASGDVIGFSLPWNLWGKCNYQ